MRSASGFDSAWPITLTQTVQNLIRRGAADEHLVVRIAKAQLPHFPSGRLGIVRRLGDLRLSRGQTQVGTRRLAVGNRPGRASGSCIANSRSTKLGN